ncbi:hypothetical protein MTO96_037854 [Rhipicephalus appendiculatus]
MAEASHAVSKKGRPQRKPKTVKRNLEKQLKDEKRMGISKSIQHRVDQFLFHYRNTPCAATGKTPAELFLSWTPRTRLTLLHPELHNRLENHERRQAQPPAVRWREFREGDRESIGFFLLRPSSLTAAVEVREALGVGLLLEADRPLEAKRLRDTERSREIERLRLLERPLERLLERHLGSPPERLFE